MVHDDHGCLGNHHGDCYPGYPRVEDQCAHVWHWRPYWRCHGGQFLRGKIQPLLHVYGVIHHSRAGRHFAANPQAAHAATGDSRFFARVPGFISVCADRHTDINILFFRFDNRELSRIFIPEYIILLNYNHFSIFC